MRRGLPKPLTRVDLRRWLWIAWVVLGVSLPSSAHLELCFCGGLSGLWTAGGCVAEQQARADTASSCCAGAGAREGSEQTSATSEPALACPCGSVEAQSDVRAPLGRGDGAPALLAAGSPVRVLQPPLGFALHASASCAASGRSNAPLRIPLRI